MMDEGTFKFLILEAGPLMTREITNLRNPVSVEECLMITLRGLLFVSVFIINIANANKKLYHTIRIQILEVSLSQQTPVFGHE